ncbi:MAG TPA: vitamin B12 dependent-methionine synthase activation domain-containing protein [Caproiciproducens sp.]|nr:vitamin B12 dependent-methionine synthase activation domain-containing protein [Caproiciproducens sp.]
MKVDRNEVLRYLGYHGKPAGWEVLEQVESCLAELGGAVSPRSVSRIFPVTFREQGVSVGSLEIQSNDLRRHISGCGEAILFAATLGAQADLLMLRYSKTDMTRAVILQACAAALTESYCDDCGQQMAAEAAKRGLYLRPRFSPGYGDFSISHQADFLKILDCPKKIGLTMTDSSMLVPSKSVTAVIGLTDREQSCHIAKCMECKATDCPFRKDNS